MLIFGLKIDDPTLICTDIHFLPLHPFSTTKEGQASVLEAAIIILSDSPKISGTLWLPPAKAAQCCCPFALQVLLMNQEVGAAELDFLLRSPVQTGVTSPVEFLSHQAWGGIKVSIGP